MKEEVGVEVHRSCLCEHIETFNRSHHFRTMEAAVSISVTLNEWINLEGVVIHEYVFVLVFEKVAVLEDYRSAFASILKPSIPLMDRSRVTCEQWSSLGVRATLKG